MSSTTVGRLLHELGYRLQKELVGDFKNEGRKRQPKGEPEPVSVHDFPQDAAGKAIPYGIYDMGSNEAWVRVGRDPDTPALAAASLRQGCNELGGRRYPEAREVFITADAGGGNGYRCRAWKHGLQPFADETGVRLHVSHFPPDTSKWNKIKHRLLCRLAQNRRGKPLRPFETIVDLLGGTRTAAGLRVQAKLDTRARPQPVWRRRRPRWRPCRCIAERFTATGTTSCDRGETGNLISIRVLNDRYVRLPTGKGG